MALFMLLMMLTQFGIFDHAQSQDGLITWHVFERENPLTGGIIHYFFKQEGRRITFTQRVEMRPCG